MLPRAELTSNIQQSIWRGNRKGSKTVKSLTLVLGKQLSSVLDVRWTSNSYHANIRLILFRKKLLVKIISLSEHRNWVSHAIELDVMHSFLLALILCPPWVPSYRHPVPTNSNSWGTSFGNAESAVDLGGMKCVALFVFIWAGSEGTWKKANSPD